jgi:calcineurin-like phosphoesterase family protein
MRIGILNDLHLGHHGEGQWHNWLMYERAEEIARAVIAVLNRQALDAVFVLGDITEAGQPEQLALARDVLSALAAPWYALPGNHDRAAVRSGQFDAAFADHVLPPYRRWGEIGIATIRERVPADMHDESSYPPDGAWIDQALAGARDNAPHTLVVLSHFPLVGEQWWADEHGGKYAGHLAQGESWLAPFTELSRRRAVILCGHEHWHHVTQSHRWIQVTAAAQIEYPIEARVLEVDGDALRITTFDTPVDTIASESLVAPAMDWVRGRDQDRNVEISLLPQVALPNQTH